MFAVVHQLTPQPDARKALEDTLKELARKDREADGFLAHQLLRPREEGKPYLLFTLWEDEQRFEAWMETQSEHGDEPLAGMLAEAPLAGPYDSVFMVHHR